jgi:choline/glycine/proline betaine transport protein
VRALTLRTASDPGRELVGNKGVFKGVHPALTAMSVVLVLGFVAFTIADLDSATLVFSATRDWIAQTLVGYYVGVACAALLVTLALMCSRYGRIRLGADGEVPEFSTFSWLAMLFSAAIGIGLPFWGIAEPIQHFGGNPFARMAGVAPGSAEAARVALRVTVFHWGLHGWALYALTGLAMAYFAYRKGLPLAVRSALYPFIGERIYGLPGHAIDLLALFGTIFGTATSLGLGASMMSTGLGELFGVDASLATQVLLIAGISAIATLSAVSGVHRGIRILSEWNIRISAALLVFFLIAGPTLYLLSLLVTMPWDYLRHAIPMGLWIDSDPEARWQSAWTLFYWGWYISWAPFVGMFIARISRGRTIREFLVGALLVSPLMGLVWFCILGGTALNIELTQPAAGLTQTVSENMTLAIYRTLELMDVGFLTWPAGALATVLVATWFITSADSMTLVVCTILSLGNPHPLRRQRIFWGASVGAVAAALLAAGGIETLQAAAIVSALPFSVVMLIMAAALIRSVAREPATRVR